MKGLKHSVSELVFYNDDMILGSMEMADVIIAILRDKMRMHDEIKSYV